MERISTIYLKLAVLALLSSLTVACSSSKAYSIQKEPTIEQIIAESDQICLRKTLFVFSSRPCISIKGEKDNSSGIVQYYLRYEIGSFDVDLPLGTSIQLGETWYTLKKSSTNYSETITVVSLLTPEVLTNLTNANHIEISYTNRAKTENFVLSGSQKERLKEDFVRIQRLLESEKKMIILKK
ncbi:MAG: hypothetical protein O9264_06825 [Leptospira sp.]|nr:hypothetical protein [Leptospira sp.]